MPAPRAIVRSEPVTPDRLFREQTADAYILIGSEGIALFKQSLGFLESYSQLSGLALLEGLSEISPVPFPTVGSRRVKYRIEGRMPILPVPTEEWLERD